MIPGLCTAQNIGGRTGFCHCPILYIARQLSLLTTGDGAREHLWMILRYHKMSVLLCEGSATDLFHEYGAHIQFFRHAVCSCLHFPNDTSGIINRMGVYLIPGADLRSNVRFFKTNKSVLTIKDCQQRQRHDK